MEKLILNSILRSNPLSVHLRNIQPKLNRYRAYTISVNPIQLGSKHTIYIVTQSWGRIGWKMRRKVSSFENLANAEKYINTLYKRRLSHGYKLLKQGSRSEKKRSVVIDIHAHLVHPAQMSLFG